MSKKAKWLEALQKGETTRARSGSQEKRLAKELKGRTTFNSGATFGQNDVITDAIEVEAKTTAKASYTLKTSDWEKLVEKCSVHKVPVFVINFEGKEIELAVLTLADLKRLL